VLLLLLPTVSVVGATMPPAPPPRLTTTHAVCGGMCYVVVHTPDYYEVMYRVYRIVTCRYNQYS